MPDWLRVFPRDQIYVIRSEDYFANRKPILDDVIEFLNLGICFIKMIFVELFV